MQAKFVGLHLFAGSFLFAHPRWLPLIGEAIGGAFVLLAAAVSYVFLKIYTLLINSAADVI